MTPTPSISTVFDENHDGIDAETAINSANKIQQHERESIIILVLGDENVGKTSLISTFVSRYFPETAPGLITRVKLPQDPQNSTITTIIDSKNGDHALQLKLLSQSLTSDRSGSQQLTIPVHSQASTMQTQTSLPTSMLDKIDSIILVYSLDCIETFQRIENHWLPLIERCYRNKEIPVIVAGNKLKPTVTTYVNTSEQEQQQGSTRREIVAIMSRYRFIRQWIKCSAKNMKRVDDVFLKSQQAVLYPISPLYDLETGCLTTKYKKALLRIFRIYDEDNDFLLKDDEILKFQYKNFHSNLDSNSLETYKSQINGNNNQCFFGNNHLLDWKKIISKKYPDDPILSSSSSSSVTTSIPVSTHDTPVPTRFVSDDDKHFTETGFLAIFDTFINQNRLEHCWRVLRNFGYTDDLQLIYPSLSYSSTSENHSTRCSKNWKLSQASKAFLTDVFYQFDTDNDELLAIQDLICIFSILPIPLPLWHPKRLSNTFTSHNTFSIPKITKQQKKLQAQSHLQNRQQQRQYGLSLSPLPKKATPSPPQQEEVHYSQNKDQQRNMEESNMDCTNENEFSTNSTPGDMGSPVLSTSGITILSEDSIPTIGSNSSSSDCATRANYNADANVLKKNIATDVHHQSFFLNNNKSETINYYDWMGYWYTLASISPEITQKELFCLGHIEGKNLPINDNRCDNKHSTNKKNVKKAISGINDNHHHEHSGSSNTFKKKKDHCWSSSREIKVLLIGSKGSGKSAFLDSVCRNVIRSASDDDNNIYYKITNTDATSVTPPETCSAYIHLNKNQRSKRNGSEDADDNILTAHIVFTELPCNHYSIAPNSKNEYNDTFEDIMINENHYDIFLLLFDSTDNNSFIFVKKLEEQFLSGGTADNIPRIYIGTKLDKVIKNIASNIVDKSDRNLVVDSTLKKIDTKETDMEALTPAIKNAKVHCNNLDLEPPVLVSCNNVIAEEKTSEFNQIVSNLSTESDDLNEIPQANQKERIKTPVTINKDKDIVNTNKKSHNDTKRQILLEHIARSSNTLFKEIQYRKKSRPHEQKRRDAAWKNTRNMILFSGISIVFGFGVVVVGVKLMWGNSSGSNVSVRNTSKNSTTACASSIAFSGLEKVHATSTSDSSTLARWRFCSFW